MMRHEDWDRLIEAEHAQSGGMDFSAHGVKSRYESGYKAVAICSLRGKTSASSLPPLKLTVLMPHKLRGIFRMSSSSRSRGGDNH